MQKVISKSIWPLYLPLLLISFRTNRNDRKISCQSLSRYESPPRSTSNWILVHYGLFWPFQPISLNFSRYVNSRWYLKKHTFLRFKWFLLNEMIPWQQSPTRCWFLKGNHLLTARSFSFFFCFFFCVFVFSTFSLLLFQPFAHSLPYIDLLLFNS